MRDSRLRRWLAILVFFVVPFGPTVALAQEPRAGVVTTVEGQALLARPTLSQPVGLKFKDDLFARDRIETKEDSIVRVLLGGKAVVTIRELSVFTVTEEPGRAAIDLRSGRLAVGVAKSLLRPGEVIEIRTPNAVAGIRGSLLVAEVGCVTEIGRPLSRCPEVGGVPQSAFTALQATVPITIATLANPNLTVSLSPNQTVSVSGAGGAATVGPVLNITPAQAQRAAATAAAPRQAGQATTSLLDSQMTTTQVAQAAGLASLIAPASQTPLKTAGVVSVVPPPSTAQLGVNETEAGVVASVVEAAKPDVPDITIIDTTKNVPPGDTLKTYTGTSSRPGTSPVVLISNSQASGPGSLLTVAPGADASLNGPLLEMSGPTVQASTLTVGTNVVDIRGRLSAATAAALLQFDTTAVVSGNGFASVNTGGALSLAGPFVSAVRTAFRVGDPTSNAFSFLFVGDSATLSSTSNSPLISLDSSAIDSAGSIVSLRRSTSGGAPSKLTLSGPLFSAVNGSSLNTTSLGFFQQFGTVAAACCTSFSITQGAQLTDTTTAPLIQLSNSTLTGADAQSGGNFFAVSDTFNGAPANELVASSSVNLSGPLLNVSGGSLSALFNLLSVTRSSFTSTSPNPLIQLSGTTVNVGGIDPFTGANAASRIVVVSASSTTPAALNLQGALLNATNSAITSGDEILGVFNGASLTSTGTGSLLSINGGSATAGTAVAPGSGGNFMAFSSGLGLPPSSVSLAGPLLGAVNTSLKNGNPTSNTYSFVFIGDGATVTSTSGASFFSFDNTSPDTPGGLLSLRRSRSVALPSKLTLSGPLFSAVNNSSFNSTSLGFGSTFGVAGAACCDMFFIGQGAQLTSTTSAPLIQLTNSTFNAGPDAQSGGNLVGIFNTFGGAPAAELVAPASVALSGPLLKADPSTISALFSLLDIGRSSLSSSSADALIQLSASTVTLGGVNPFGNVGTFGRLVNVSSSPSSGTVASPASVSLTGTGPLLLATNSTLNLTADLVGVFNGATLSSATTASLIQLHGGALTTNTNSGFNGFVLDVSGTGGPTGAGLATVNLSGPLYSGTGTLNLAGGLANVTNGGQMTLTGVTDPFVSIIGGNQTINSSPNFGMFRLLGRGTATAFDTESGLILGTDRMIQGTLQPDGTRPVPVSLLETSGAAVTGQRVVNIDTALLEATAPLLNLKAGSVMTSSVDAINLNSRANVSVSGSDLVRLDASVLNVTNGALALVAGGSKLTVGGNLVNLLNGATLTIFNGPLITVSGSSFVNITGSLISFGGTGGNKVNITNSLCPCSIIGGVPVALQNGALAANVQITNPIKNAGLGQLNLSSENAALAVVNGANTKLKVSGK